jgi:hypothetical protein
MVGLILMNGLIVQPDGEAAEHHHHDAENSRSGETYGSGSRRRPGRDHRAMNAPWRRRPLARPARREKLTRKKTSSGPTSIAARAAPVGSRVASVVMPEAPQWPGHGARIEWPQIIYSFTHPDRMDRQAEFLRRRDQDAAARGAVELGHDEAGHSGVARTLRSGSSAFCPVVASEDEDHVVRRFGIEAAEHAADLGELVHQVRLVLEAPGGVDDQRVDAGRGACLTPS